MHPSILCLSVLDKYPSLEKATQKISNYTIMNIIVILNTWSVSSLKTTWDTTKMSRPLILTVKETDPFRIITVPISSILK